MSLAGRRAGLDAKWSLLWFGIKQQKLASRVGHRLGMPEVRCGHRANLPYTCTSLPPIESMKFVALLEK